MRPIQAGSTQDSCISGVPNVVQHATPVPTKDSTKTGRARDQDAATASRNREKPRTKDAKPDSLRKRGRSVNRKSEENWWL
jgi:hypothetical protein